VAVLAGLLVAVTAGLAIGYWRQIAKGYHLHRLRATPDYALAIVTEPEGTPQREALRAFLQMPTGQRSLLEVFVDAACEELEKPTERTTQPQSQSAVVFTSSSSLSSSVVYGRSPDPPVAELLGTATLKTASFSVRAGDGAKRISLDLVCFCDGGVHPIFQRSCSHAALAELQALLGSLAGDRRWTLPGYPGMRFRISRVTSEPTVSLNRTVGELSPQYQIIAEPGPDVIPRLIAQLESEVETARNDAAVALAGHGDEALPALLEAVEKHDDDRGFGLAAARAFGGIGPGGAAGLAELLGHGAPDVRAEAAYSLQTLASWLRPEAGRVLPALLENLRDRHTGVRRAAGRALVALVRPGSPVAPEVLLEALRDEDSVVRARAAMALGNLENDSAEVVRTLGSALADPDDRVRFRAAQSLGDLGPAAAAAAPRLRQALKDEHGLVQHHAKVALARIGAGEPPAGKARAVKD
jgi:HEAT repeat protein